jgi:hypothetical protein
MNNWYMRRVEHFPDLSCARVKRVGLGRGLGLGLGRGVNGWGLCAKDRVYTGRVDDDVRFDCRCVDGGSSFDVRNLRNDPILVEVWGDYVAKLRGQDLLHGTPRGVGPRARRLFDNLMRRVGSAKAVVRNWAYSMLRCSTTGNN